MSRPVSLEAAEPERTTAATADGFDALPRRALGELRAAVAMLTRLPVHGVPVAGTGAGAYPVVGGLLGLATFLPLAAVASVSPVGAAILAVASVAVLSGSLHLDGLADTFDALAAVGPDAAERARRDPAIGAAGATALVLVLGLDVAVLATLLADRGVVFAGLACVVAGSVSRLVPTMLARLARSASAVDGLGAWFVRRITTRTVAGGLVTCLVVVLASTIAVGGSELIAAGLIAGVTGVGLGVGLVRLRHQLDGDLLGATVELSFAASMLATAVVAAWSPA